MTRKTWERIKTGVQIVIIGVIVVLFWLFMAFLVFAAGTPGVH